MAAEPPPAGRRGRPALDWEQAFLFYAALPPERRDYAGVATEFGVSPRTVERHGRRERWRERARALDREAAATAAARLVEQRVEKLSDFERLVEATLVGYAQKLREGTIRLSPADLPRLYRLLQELWEGAGVEPSEPRPEAAAAERPDPLEHKLAVLRALREARVLEQLEERADDEHDRARDARAPGAPEREAGERPRQPGARR